MKHWSVFSNGLLKENPTLRLVLGMCPTLAVTTSAINGLGMGVCVLFVLVCSNLLISALRRFIPSGMRIPGYIVVIATFSTLVEMLCEAFAPGLYSALGIFLPLVVVNCIILGRAEAFAGKNTVVASLFDGLGMGIGFTLALFVVASLREVLGNGTWLGLSLGMAQPMRLMLLAPGGFITLGLVMAAFQALMKPRKKRV